MLTAFQNLSVKALVLEPLASRRAQISDILRQIGLKRITVASSTADAVALMASEEDEPFGWILTPVNVADQVNGLSLLAMCLLEPKYRSTRVSFLVEATELGMLKSAFELGLLSWHRRDRVGNDLAVELRALFETGDAYLWDESLVASHYLRTCLNDDVADRLVLEQALAAIYPDNPRLLLNLGEAQIVAGLRAEGIRNLARAKAALPSLTPEIERIVEHRLSKDTSTPLLERIGNATAVVIDADMASHNHLKDVLDTVGFAKTEFFEQGAAAWAWLEANDEPGIIIMEWRLTGITGSALIQRIRSRGWQSVPIIVYSSLVRLGDRVLLRDMGVTDVIEKPLGKRFLAEALKVSLERELAPREVDDLAARIRKLCGSNRLAEAKTHRQTLLGRQDVPNVVKLAVEAEVAFAEGHYGAARKFAIDALTGSDDTLPLLSLLAKTLLKLNEHEAALKVLKKASALSPENAAKLCAVSELSAATGDLTTATDALTKAKTIDAGSSVVIETDAKLALVQGDTDRARELMADIDSLSGVIGYLNNTAVVLVNKGETDEAIKLYERALASIPVAKTDVGAVVHYNFALALARQGSTEAAEEHLQAAVAAGDSPVLQRAGALAKRASDAKRRGEVLKLNVQTEVKNDDATTPDDQPAHGIPEVKGVLPGEVCLYRIFRSTASVHADITKALAHMPKSGRRQDAVSDVTKLRKAR